MTLQPEVASHNQRSDVSNFETDYANNYDNLVGFIITWCGWQRADAEDTAQTAFAKYYTAGYADADRNNPPAILHTIAKHAAIDEVRRESHRPTLYDPQDPVGVLGASYLFSEQTPSAEDTILKGLSLTDVLVCLPENTTKKGIDYRALFHGLYIEGLSYKEYALKNDLPEMTVRTQCYRLHKLLKASAEAKNLLSDLL